MEGLEGLERLYSSAEGKEVALEFESIKIPIKVKELGWSKKNQILGQCFIYNADGSLSFNIDRYVKLCLVEIIVSAPWGETNMVFLNQIKSSFGDLLQKTLVPRAFEETKVSSFFDKE